MSPGGLHELSHHDGQDDLRQVVGEVDDGHVPPETDGLVVSGAVVDLWVGMVLCDLKGVHNFIILQLRGQFLNANCS